MLNLAILFLLWYLLLYLNTWNVLKYSIILCQKVLSQGDKSNLTCSSAILSLSLHWHIHGSSSSGPEMDQTFLFDLELKKNTHMWHEQTPLWNCKKQSFTSTVEINFMRDQGGSKSCSQSGARENLNIHSSSLTLKEVCQFSPEPDLDRDKGSPPNTSPVTALLSQ